MQMLIDDRDADDDDYDDVLIFKDDHAELSHPTVCLLATDLAFLKAHSIV